MKKRVIYSLEFFDRFSTKKSQRLEFVDEMPLPLWMSLQNASESISFITKSNIQIEKQR